MNATLRAASATILKAFAAVLCSYVCTGATANPVDKGSRLPAQYDVEIRYTAFAIPHIKADDYGSLGYGLGYAYAEQNVCLVADALLTVRGERSLFLGSDGTTSVSFQKVKNIDSDIFFRFYLDPEMIVAAYRNGPSEVLALSRGYAEGYNRYLRDTPAAALPLACREAPWVRPMSEKDFYLLLAEKAIQVSGGQFLAGIVNAQPPDMAGNGLGALDNPATLPADTASGFGSNAYAIGRDLSANATGVLLGNPHFPWETTNRFFQFHLTIPGTLDVMGASISTFPVVNIGFNRDVAWSHTVSTARRFTLYELTLVEGDPQAYLFEGRSENLKPRTIEVDVRLPDGSVGQQSRVLYESRFGPVLVLPSLGLTWTKASTFAIRDAQRFNTRMVEQWLRINRARSVAEIKQALDVTLGIPWVNTIAADRFGSVLYADISAAPNVSNEKLASCRRSATATQAWNKARVPVLDGTREYCLWAVDPSTPEAGLLSAEAMPSLIRRDFVLNSNDSFWLANTNAPLTGYPEVLGLANVQQGWRTRMGYLQLDRLRGSRPRGIASEDLEAMLFANENYTAGIVIERLDDVCRAPASAVDRACSVLMAWNRRNAAGSRGAALYREFWRRAQKISGLWVVRFDARQPLDSPRELNLHDERVREQLRLALRETVGAFDELGIALDAPLGDLQYRTTKSGLIPIAGGTDMEGVLNLVRFGPLTKKGYGNDNIFGSSYIQLVTWEGDHVIAKGLLANSQSSNPDSAHYSDQTQMFSIGRLVRLPFTDSEIARDPDLRVRRLTQ